MADAPSGSREAAVLDRITAFRRRRPRLTDDVVTLAHGAGGKASAALVDAIFLEAFAGPERRPLPDAATLVLPGGDRLAFSTDTFVVAPSRFPGGSIGHLAVHGTVNDVAVQGGRPAWLAAAFVIEEGFAVDELRAIVADMAEAAADAGVAIVTGDTKVVGRGAADGIFISTTGIGVIPVDRSLGPELVEPGDRVLVSGTIGDHGMAVMLARGDLALEADIRSDTAPVNGLVEALLAAAPGTRWMRDPTRGGVGTVCNELARDAGVAVVLEEMALPVDTAVARRLRPARDRPAVRRQRGQGRRRRARRRGRLGPRRHACPPARHGVDRHRRDRRRAGGHRRAAHRLRRHTHRRHARRRPAPAHLLMKPARTRFRVTGTVQGVGFRPFVYRRAVELGLAGFVRNDSGGVLIEVEGDPSTIDAARGSLRDDAPPLARVDDVVSAPMEPLGADSGFTIEHSEAHGPRRQCR